MSFLRIFCFGFEYAWLIGDVLSAIAFGNDFTNFGKGNCRERDGVRTHIGDQTNLILAWQCNSFVKFLRYAHGALRIKAEFSRCFLL